MAGQPEPTCRILVMASGNGSNLQALLDAVATNRIPNSKIVRVIVNRSKAYAVTRAEKSGVPCEYFNYISHGFLEKGEKNEEKIKLARERYDAALAEKILALPLDEKPDLIVLAGWMHVFSAGFLAPLDKEGIKVINLHPALPGAYTGAGAIERSFNDFKAGKPVRMGIMIHYVILEVDEGEPIMVREIEGREGEELSQLEDRIHSHEHELIVEATAKVVGEILDRKKSK